MNFIEIYNLHKIKPNSTVCNYSCVEGIINLITKNNDIIIKNITMNSKINKQNSDMNIINNLINYIVEDQYFDNIIINDFIYINLFPQMFENLKPELYTNGIRTITNTSTVTNNKNGTHITNIDIKDVDNNTYFIIKITKSYKKIIAKIENEWSNLWIEKMTNAKLRLIWDLIDSSNVSEKKLNEIIIDKQIHSSLFLKLCENSNITIQFIKNNKKNINFDYYNIFKGKLLTYNMIKKNKDFLFDGCSKQRIKDYFDILCQNPNITMKDIQENPHIFNCLRNLSRNPNITWEFIKSKIDENNQSLININWSRLCINSNLKFEDIKYIWLNYPNVFIEHKFGVNPNITWDIVKNNMDIPWNWLDISENCNITWHIIKNNLNNNLYNWNWGSISMNQNITWDIVESNPEMPWDYNGLSLNPNITFEIIDANPDKPWIWTFILTNNFIKEIYMRRKLSDWFKRSELKEELMKAVWHPRNFWKFKYLDPETFGDINENNDDNDECS